jgi:SulP family sulfate permease
VACTLLVPLLDLPVVTVGDRFGALPDGLPTPSVPTFDLETVRAVAPDAVAIALLAAIESLLSAVVADGMAGTRHRPDMELVAQGVANIAVPLFGGIPATGAIARTATNIRSGGRTPVAGMVHALTVLGAMLFLGGAVARIPLAALAGILLVVAFHMSEWRVFAHLFRSPRSDVAVLLTTFALTVAVDLAVAIQVGVVLASILFLRRMASLSDARVMRPMLVEEEEPQPAFELPAGVDVYEVHGALFFGAASKFREAVRPTTRRPRVLVLRMRDVVAVDATGLRALEDILDKSRRDGTTLVLSGVRAQPRRAMERSGLLDRIGAEHVHSALPEALAHARALVSADGEAPREARG